MEDNERNEMFVKFFNEEAKKVEKMSNEELEIHLFELTKLIIQLRAKIAATNHKWR